MSNDTCVYEGILRGRSGRSILVEIGDGRYWLPVSEVGAHEDVTLGAPIHLEIPAWLCDDRGIY